ncbi:MAG: gliding motility-associated C-terminal domain-containing protein [Salibacteraceae bacterium]
MKKVCGKYVFLFCSLLLISDSALSGHLVGGDLSYECISPNRYVITLQMYRDCNSAGAQFDDNVSIRAFEGTSEVLFQTIRLDFNQTVQQLEFSQDIQCLADTPDICIETTIYSDTVTIFLPPSGVTLVHQRCCRPINVVNIKNVTDVGSTFTTLIPNVGEFNCNSSPRFNETPPIALCAMINMSIDYSATDLDGDSLVYSFCTPFHGGSPANPAPAPEPPPFQIVPWEVGFSDQHQITALPSLTIDPETGIISGRPTAVGTYTFGVCVEEWRNGVLLNQISRDFQLTITPCEVDASAAIDSVLEECIGFDISFFNLSSMGNNFLWTFGDSTTLDDTSSAVNPSYTFPDTGTYSIELIAFGDVCSDTTYLDYRVQHKIEPYFSVPEPECLNRHKYVFEAEGFYRASTDVLWDFGQDSAEISDDLLPVATKVFDSAGTYEISLHFIDERLGCHKTYSDSATVFPNPSTELSDSLLEQCAPFSGKVFTTNRHAYKVSYDWFINSSLVSNSSTLLFETKTPGVYDVNVRLTTDSNCIDTIEIYVPRMITVKDTPVADFYLPNMSAGMFEPYFTLYDTSINALSWQFSIENEPLTRSSKHDFALADTGNYIISQLAWHANGCTDTLYKTIRVEPEYLTYIPNAFTPNQDGYNDIWLPEVFVHDTYHLKIYNRWGNLVFETKDVHNGWNGHIRNNGKECPLGVYTYDIYITDHHGKNWHYTDKLSLLR